MPERDIPGYGVELHRGLSRTIAEPGDLRCSGIAFTCHESGNDAPIPCAGWLHNQIGVGNNIPLRIAVACGKIDGNVKTVGPQHKRFEDTLPGGAI